MIIVKNEEYEITRDSEGRSFVRFLNHNNSYSKNKLYIIKSSIGTYVAQSEVGSKFTRDVDSARKFNKDEADRIAERMSYGGNPDITWEAIPFRS